MYVGILLTEARIGLGLTQMAVAERLHLSPVMIGQLEKGNKPLLPKHVPLVVENLKIHHHQLANAMILDFSSKLKEDLKTFLEELQSVGAI